MDDIVRLPPTVKFMGSCPNCGAFIWSSDLVHVDNESQQAVYKCIKCKELVLHEGLIPF